MLVCGIVIVLTVLLCIALFMKEPYQRTDSESMWLVPFKRVASGFYRLLFCSSDNTMPLFRRMLSERASKVEAEAIAIKKLTQSLLILLVGGVILSIWGYAQEGSQSAIEGRTVHRPGYTEESKEYILIAKLPDGEEKMQLNVSGREYTRDEFNEICRDYFEQIVALILASNESTQCITENLNFDSIEFPEEYPFDVEVISKDRGVINDEGIISSEVPSEGVSIAIDVEIYYIDEVFSKEFEVCVYPREMTEWERQIHELEEKMVQAETSSRINEEFELPQYVDDVEITWMEQSSVKNYMPIVLLFGFAIANYVFRSTDIKRQIKKREQVLSDTYPIIVSKLGIYLGAGVPIKEAFKRIATEYQTDSSSAGNPAYEEMSMTVREMESGIPELKAYEDFGKRCGGKEFIKFGMLLSSHGKMGGAGILKELREEGNRAWEDKKAGAKRKGEEAGTKLLLPMMLLLVIVMVVIMIPAFSSFSL